MSVITDVLIPKPVGDALSRFLMFMLFYIHLFLILIMIGTAIIGMFVFYHSYFTNTKFEIRWDKKILKLFIAPKAIGVSFGVLALLVVQLYYAVPFYTAMSLFAPWWLLVIPIMIVAFLIIDGISHTIEVHPIISYFLGTFGLILLLVVPGVFVLIMVAMENTWAWAEIIQGGFKLPQGLALHWLFRYLHILGASLVFGAGFHYYLTSEHHEYRRRQMMQWIFFGLAIQFLLGGLLTLTLQEWIDRFTLIPLGIGILAATLAVFFMYRGTWRQSAVHLGPTVFLLPVILLGMLVTRQYIQQQKILPLLDRAEANALAYKEVLKPYRLHELAGLNRQLRTVYDNGQEIFQNSCRFCHGLDGMNTPEGEHLIVPPEKLSQVRSSRAHLYDVLKNGVPGAGMPYFSVFERQRVEDIIDHLQYRFNIMNAAESVPVKPSAQDTAAAGKFFNTTCSMCHGLDGAGTLYATQFLPPPPNFQLFSLTPQRAAEILRDGYRGTAMQSFEELPEGERWALVEKVNAFRAGR